LSWQDRFNQAAKSLNSAWGAAVDLATSPFDDDDESFDELMGKLGQLTIGAANSVAQTGIGLVGGGLWAADKIAENVVLEPLSTAVTAGSLADSPTWGKGIFDSATWSHARGIADYRSFGQAIALGFTTEDILAEEAEIERLKQGFLFNAVSGSIDAAANIFLDPLAVVGKVGTAGRAVSKGFGAGHRPSDPWLQRQIVKRTKIGVGDVDPYDYAQSEAVSQFLAWTANKNGRVIANHPAVKASPYRSVVAGLLQEADESTARLIIATAYGSRKAVRELAARRDDLAMRMARADNQVNFALQHEVSRGWRDKMPVMAPAIKHKTPLPEPDPAQLSLFDIAAFPKGKLGPGGSKVKDPESLEPHRGGPTGPAGKGYDYPNVSGNLPETVRGKYFVAPKDDDSYWMRGPVNKDSVKELARYFRGDAKGRAAAKWEQMSIPGLPAKDSQWKQATSWKQHNKTIGQTIDEWDEQLSMRIMPWDRQATKWFRSIQRELAQKAGKELDLLNAAIGSDPLGGRGVWGSMIDQVITGDKQLRKADSTLAYDWDSRSLVAETVIHPKTFGLPVRVVQGAPFALMRSFTEKRAPSWIDPNRGDSHAAFAAYLNGIKVFDPRSKDILMRRYMKAFDPSEKRELLARTEATAIRQMALSYGLSEEAATEIAKRSVSERNSIITQLRKKKTNNYAADVAVTEQRFPWEDFPIDDDLIPVTSPILETQEVNSIPLLDLDAYDRAFRQNSELLGAFDRGAASVSEFMDKAYDVLNPLWSFSVLMRFGYTVRTLTDDMLRIWASLGAMSIMGNISAGVKNMDRSLLQRGRNLKTRTKILGARAYGATFARNSEDAAKVIGQLTDEMGRDLETVTTIGDLGFTYRGHKFQGPYEGKGEVYKQIVGGSYEAIARSSRELIEQLRSDYAGWEVKRPGDADHLDSWVYAINNQIAKSAIGKKYLEGWNAKQVERWLRHSAEGHQVRKKIGTHGRDPQRLAGMVQATVDQYIPILRDSSDPMMLRRLALEGKLDAKTLEQVFPDEMLRPQVHGPSVDFNLLQGPIHKYIDGIVSTGFKWLSQIPSDKLMRHPTFRTLYKDSIRKQYDNLRRQNDGEAWVFASDLRAMEHTARETALKGVTSLLYDVSTKSNAAHFMRFVTSFFSAWEDSLTKWSQLAMDKPQLLLMGTKVYEAPNEMNFGMTEDEAGNPVPRISVVDSQGKPVKPEDATVDDESRIIARLPKWLLKAIPGAEEFGSAAIPKSSLNLILQGNPWWLPGAGPLIQVPISSVAAKQPTLKNIYEWAVPHGQQSIADVMLPGWAKQAIKGNEGINDPAYAYIYLQIAQTEEMRIRTGQRTRPGSVDFAREINDRTQAAFKIRSFTRFFLPFTADLQSPYQFYIDQYRQMADVHGDKADEKFYEKFGDDLYLFTTALSKNNVGLRASESAWKARQEYADLIAANPEYGALIVGPEANKGDFNQYIHAAQFNTQIGPGSDRTLRERRSPVEALKDNDRSLGWLKFKRYMGLVDEIAEGGKLTTDQLGAARRFVAEFIAEKHKAWADDYYESDLKAIPKRIEFLTMISKDPKIINNPLRTDIRVLADYLAIRQQFTSHLAELKKNDLPSTLSAAANKGIADEWTRTKEALALSDTRFADLYWRYLSNDNLQV